MELQDAIARLVELRGEKLAKKDRWRLSKRWLKGLDPASVSFRGVTLGHSGFDAVVTSDGFKDIYIGIPGAFRVWMKLDGTYRIDVPNETAERNGS
jgi:hypothetical protein